MMTHRNSKIRLFAAFVALAMLALAPASAQEEGRFIPGSELDGTWEGILSNGGMGLNMYLNIKTTVQGGTVVTLDVMEPEAKDIPVSAMTRDQSRIKLEFKDIGGAFEGLVTADLKAMSGRWIQTGAAGPSVPLILRRKS
jgi:hypothetical protein